MATATAITRGGDKVELEVGVPQILTLRFDEPKETPYSLMYGCAEGTLYIPLKGDEASTFEHQMSELGLRKGDSFRLTKIKHGGRGGGFAYRIERTGSGTATDRDYSEQLQKSIDMQRAQTSAPRTGAPEADRAPVQHHKEMDNGGSSTAAQQPNGRTVYGSAHPQAGPLSPTALRYMGCYKDAVDILLETQGYAKSQGLLLEVTCESVRCLAATIAIGGGR